MPVIPNTQLASIDNITMAKQAQAVLEAQEAEKQVRYDATAAARELEQQSFELLHLYIPSKLVRPRSCAANGAETL